MLKKIIALNVFLIVAIFCIWQNVFGYNSVTTHPILSQAAISVYNSTANQQISEEQKIAVIKGAIEEDAPPRWLNHFYNPQTGKGLFFLVQNFSAKEWSQNQSLTSVLSGDFSESAILNSYKNSNEIKAYEGVGHIVHLIQDMTVPAHVRDDVHIQADPYEAWATDFGDVTKIKSSKNNVSGLNGVFDNLAYFTNGEFFSKDSVDLNFKYDYVKNEKSGNGQFYDYAYYRNHKIYRIDNFSGGSKYYFDDAVNSDYWSILAPKAIGYSAGVIEYFVKKFQEIDQAKKLAQEKASFLERLQSSFTQTLKNAQYAMGDILSPLAIGGVDALSGWFDNTGNVAAVYNNYTAPVATSAPAPEFKIASVAPTPQSSAGTEIKSAVTTNQVVIQPAPAPQQTSGIKIINPDYNAIPAPTVLLDGQTQKTEIIILPLRSNPPLVLSGSSITNAIVTQESISTSTATSTIAAPETYLTSYPDVVTSSTQASFSFLSDQASSNFACRLNLSTWQDCQSPYDFAVATSGAYFFEVLAMNSSTNLLDLTPANYSWTVAAAIATTTNQDPETFLSSPLSETTSSTQAAFIFGSDQAEATFQCSRDLSSWQDCQSPSIFSVNSGRHLFEVKAVNTYTGLEDLTPADFPWIVTSEIDDVAPVTTMGALQPEYPATGFDLAWSGDDSDPIASSSGVVSYDVEYKIDSSSWQTLLSSTTATSTMFTTPVPNGQRVYFRARAYDAAGNMGEWSSEVSTLLTNHIADHLVISEVQASGATAKDEFVELYNPTDSDISLIGYQLKRKSSGGALYLLVSDFGSAKVKSHGHYLIVHPTDYDGSATPDITYSSSGYSITADNTVILYNGGTVVDKVGFGAAGDFETATSTNPSANQSIERKAVGTSTAATMASDGAHANLGNGYDTDNNSNDFVVRALPSPQGSYQLVRQGDVSDLAIWHLDEINGTTTLDSSVHSRNFAWGYNTWSYGHPEPQRVAGRWGQGIYFGQVEEHFYFTTSSPLALTDGMTIGMWIKTSLSSNELAHFFWLGNTIDYAGIPANAIVLAMQNGQVHLKLKQNSAITKEVVASSTMVNDDAWHFVATRFDAGNNTMALFIDGQEQGSDSFVLPIPSFERADIGRRQEYFDPITTNFQGTMDDVWIKRTASSDAQIGQIYQSENPY